jgi:hypothetical protein
LFSHPESHPLDIEANEHDPDKDKVKAAERLRRRVPDRKSGWYTSAGAVSMASAGRACAPARIAGIV